MKNIISIRDFSRRDIDELMNEALELKADPTSPPPTFHPRPVASLFFEPSTRTRTSSEEAATRLGRRIIGFAGTEGTSVKKGEPLADTVRMYTGYRADAIVMRHPLEGSARFVSDIVKIPVMNAGDGCNGHPTQALIDLMTFKESFGRIDGLHIAFAGDLKYSRVVNSGLQGLVNYDTTVSLVSPPNLALPPWRINDFQAQGGKIGQVTTSLHDLVNVDVLVMLRIQRERFPEGRDGEIEFEKVSGVYHYNQALHTVLKRSNPTLKIGHPLPRFKHRIEIAFDMDSSPDALFFTQAENAPFMREALFRRIFGEGFENNIFSSAAPNYVEPLPITHSKEKPPRFYIFDEGTFIDHIEPGVGYKLRPLLGLMDYRESPLLAVNNLPSKRQGSKDVYGIANKYFTPEQLWKIALVSDSATINIIRGGEVQEKFKVRLPPLLEGIVACTNPMCVSYEDNHEHVTPKFHVEMQSPLQIRCHYCERPTGKENLKILY